MLSEPTPEGWAGAILGDFARGRLDGSRHAHWSAALRHSVRRHRSVDAFTDAHPVHARSRTRFDPPLRRFAGIVVDIGYDHFLASSFTRHTGLALDDFADEVYDGLARQASAMPAPAATLCRRMKDGDWLRSYVQRHTLPRAFAGVSRRLRRQPNALAGAGPAFFERYEALEEDFEAFFPELLRFISAGQAESRAPDETGAARSEC